MGGEVQWAVVVDEAKKASARLNVTPMRWFHWAEMFHPVGMPPTKMARLAPLAEMAAHVAAGGEQAATWQSWEDGNNVNYHDRGTTCRNELSGFSMCQVDIVVAAT